MPLALAGALRFSEDVLGMSYYSALAFTRASVALLSGMLPISAYLYLREMLAPAAMSSSTSVTSSLGGSSGVDGAFEWREIACLLGAALCAFHDAVLGLGVLPLSNTFVSPILFLALSVCCRCRPRLVPGMKDSGAKTRYATQLSSYGHAAAVAAAGAVLGLCTHIRPDCSIAIFAGAAPPALLCAVREARCWAQTQTQTQTTRAAGTKTKPPPPPPPPLPLPLPLMAAMVALLLLAPLVLGYLLGLCGGALCDRLMYGRWTFSPFNWLHFNLVLGKAAVHGTQPASFYAQQYLVQQPSVGVAVALACALLAVDCARALALSLRPPPTAAAPSGAGTCTGTAIVADADADATATAAAQGTRKRDGARTAAVAASSGGAASLFNSLLVCRATLLAQASFVGAAFSLSGHKEVVRAPVFCRPRHALRSLTRPPCRCASCTTPWCCCCCSWPPRSPGPGSGRARRWPAGRRRRDRRAGQG
jgi:hypothetical protein